MATFDWIPILEGKLMTYYQIGALVFSAIFLFLALLSFVFFLVFSKISDTQRGPFRTRRGSWVQFLKKASYVSIFIWLGFIPMVCQALDVLNFFEGVLGMFGVYVIGIYLQNGIEQGQREQFQILEMQAMNGEGRSQPLVGNGEGGLIFINRCLRGKGRNKKALILAGVMSVFWNLFFFKTCVAFYNDQIGYTSNFFGPAINTYWARWLQLKQSCPPGPPCHVYATIPEDPTTAFFLNIHTHAGLQGNVVIYYQQLFTPQPEVFETKVAESYNYDELQWLASRKIHSALISNLKPNTKYLVKAKYDNQLYVNAIYKTLPADPKVPVVMINGGDSGYTFASHNLSKIAVRYNPDIIFIGGDVAYDNNIPSCAYTWDFFLNMIEGISNEVGYMVPLVLALGNHDAGLNELSGINITLDTTAFFKYFPQQFKRNATGGIVDGVPEVKDRRSFLHFKWSKVSYTVLDSGYLHGFDGIQKQFIKHTFEANKKQVKFVNYHVPIYSACQRFDKNPQRFLYALFHWVPLFDEYRVMTVFENHVHSFKRTKPIRSSQPADKGTVYVGDGAYGAVLSFSCKPDASMNIFQKHLDKNNMWVSEIRQNQVHHVAVDSHGNIIDQFTQSNEDYLS